MQVSADQHGNVIHLFERDCSVQRRYQKVIEEAPAPGMTAERRRAMGDAAVAAARAIGYVGAGTVEFIVETGGGREGRFYFMEMNTRLQVEHPVTEMITGFDLVEWQLRVAAGEPLPVAQDAVVIRGHAIEARLYAEDPDRGFLPSIGRIAHWRMPRPSASVRVDTGFRAGDAVTADYDPMLGKVIAWGEDREHARLTLQAALQQCEIAGVANNAALVERVLGHASFVAGLVDTGLIERHRDALLPPPSPAPDAVLAAVAIVEADRYEKEAASAAARRGDPHSPWQAIDGWRPTGTLDGVTVELADADATKRIAVRRIDRHLYAIESAERSLRVIAHHRDGRLLLECDGRRIDACVVASGEERLVFAPGIRHRLRVADPLGHAGDEEPHAGRLNAPMSGTVVAVFVAAGQVVDRGTPLVVLEAMKMEHTITAPAAGVVEAVHFRVGDRVSEGEDLVDLADVTDG
jgi:3-methylcrotonyl-CoA carboxylase alpha subunit